MAKKGYVDEDGNELLWTGKKYDIYKMADESGYQIYNKKTWREIGKP
jgi:hypothetical protein